jgi:hypothetical protein
MTDITTTQFLDALNAKFHDIHAAEFTALQDQIDALEDEILVLEAYIEDLEGQLGIGTLFLEDSFTDTNGTLITAHTGETGAAWAVQSGYSPSATATIDNNRVVPASSDNCFVASGAPSDADYFVEGVIEFVSNLTSTNLGVCGRMAAAANTMYLARYLGASGGPGWHLFKAVAGTFTELGSYPESYPGNGATRTVKLIMDGSNISLHVNGVERIAVVDSSITDAGKAGFRATTAATASTGAHLQSITAGNL